MIKIVPTVDQIYSKCAEIHFQNEMCFIISCNFCSLKTNQFDEFQFHFKKSHCHELGTSYTETLLNGSTNKTENIKKDTCFQSSLDNNNSNEIQNTAIDTECIIVEYESKEQNIFEIDVDFDEFIEYEGTDDSCIVYVEGKEIFDENNDEQNDTNNKLKDVSQFNEQMGSEEGEYDSSTDLVNENFECEDCSYFGNGVSASGKHTCLKIKKKPFQCTVCEKYCTSRSELKYHTMTHSTEKPYKCNYCEKSFTFKSNRNVHQIRHTGIRRYKCDQCVKAFYSSCELRNHKRHHNDERSFICEICGNAYRHSWVLTKHRRTHGSNEKSIACSQCPKKFAHKDNLRNHMKIHSDKRSFQCDNCPASFVQRTHLNSHIRKFHQLLCEGCNEYFSSFHELYIHFEREHDDNRLN